jgi:ribosomal protein L11 methyltransferase
MHVKATFAATGGQSDILIALLTDIGYDGFEEAGDNLLAYIGEPKFSEEELQKVADMIGVTYTLETIAPQNWNEVWESNFLPVIVDDFCTIRAHFHDIKITTPYQILITPKMSFGTGHHATTQLMIQLMREVDFRGKKVLDFGTGTGVLAILAEMLEATQVLAIDNDSWCVENAEENIMRNNCSRIVVKNGSLEIADAFAPDVILANINRHILLQYMGALHRLLQPGGTILMSGLLADDESIIKEAAGREGFIFSELRMQTNWIAMRFSRI